MPFIKSHSNFVLKNRHQDVSDGTIFERDITTIGGLNQFSKGQTPIYKSGNFIITVRNDGRPSNQYNTSKWKENDSGDTWTLQTISGMVSDYEDQDDTKIVLKQDYYDFRDFAYYGSLTELFRASVTDIVARFPGELFVTNDNAYYTSAYTVDFERIESSVALSGDSCTLYVDNPFGINIYSIVKPSDANPLKYFAENGYKNYDVIIGDNVSPVTAWTSDFYYFEYDNVNKNYINYSASTSSTTIQSTSGCTKPYPCKGEKMADVTVNGKKIEAWIGDDNNIVYLSNEVGLHIRPNDTVYADFWNGCDNFQKLLINRDNGYKATFSVIRENDFGYYREFVPFVFPKTYGDYNIDATDYGFNAYTTQMVEIGEYYDENFTDNLWRSMTHEAIKNFDWTYTREYQEGDEEEYVIGGQKMQKALRVFAREFDEIISYINNIKNNNRVTYDERGNIPDYFLTDVVENEGWNVKMVYPYSLTEYAIDSRTVINPNTYTESGDCKGQLFNQEGDKVIRREFSQNSNFIIKPYSKSMIDDETEDGYFIVCNGDSCADINTVEVTPANPTIPCEGGSVEITWTLTKEKSKLTPINTPCEYKCGGEPSFTFVRANNNTLLDKCALSGKGVVKDKIKPYTDEKKWTYQDANNEFLRRLKINSPYIWRHKGTLEGIDMILGMFGMRNRKWVNAIPTWLRNCKYKHDGGKFKFDYEVIEYTSFTNRIEEPWDVVHQDYRINWINSTKTIIYDNRFISNYTKYGANSNILTYQGIPVQYREAYDNETPYIKRATLEEQLNKISATTNSGEAFVRMDGTPVRRRFLYPNFDKNEQLDGNPYFQMDGGWLSKKLHIKADKNRGDSWVNFQFDVDDNIVFTDYKQSGRLDRNGFLDDNIFLYKETIRNIRRVDNINELLSLPTVELHNGVICSVTSIERNSAVIDGVVYPITTEWSGDSTNGHSVSYISFTKTDGFIKVGKNKFFDTTMMVYDIDGNQYLYDVDGMDDGLVIKAYIKDGGTFMCQEDETGNYSITYFQELEKYYEEEGYTNYFILDDINYAEELARFESDGDTSTVSGWTSGWRRLAYGDRDFLKINTITNDYNGNNPHNGNMIYDNGHEYFLYFKRLFKHASENDLFDERCYEDFYKTLDDEIVNYGFKGLVNKNDDILQYDDTLQKFSGDTKIHYFGNYKTKKEDNTIKEVWIYGQDTDRLSGSTLENGNRRGGYNKIYDHDNVASKDIKQYILTKIVPYDKMASDSTVDEVTNQIVNNKRLTIRFYLHNKWYTEDGQNELKYIDDIVMNYLTQMIPSTTILTVEYDLGYVNEEVVTEDANQPSEGEETTTETETITETYSFTDINCENSTVTLATPSHFDKAVPIVQAAGPCCTENVTYSFSNISIECRKYDNEEVSVPYTKTIECGECPSRTEEGTSAYTINVSCNDTNRTREFTFGGELGSFTAIQLAGPCCPCECKDLTVSPTSLTWGANEVNAQTIIISKIACTQNISTSVTESHFGVALNGDTITVTPSGTNPNMQPYNGTLTISYDAVSPNGGGTVNCSSAVTLTHSAASCDCRNFSIGSTEYNADVDGGTNLIFTTVSLGNVVGCISNVGCSVEEGKTWVTARYDETDSTIKGNVEQSTTSFRSAQITITAKTSNNDTCTKTLTIKQAGCQCDSTKVTINVNNSITLDPCGATNQEIGTYTFLCNACDKSKLSFNGQGISVSFTFEDGKIFITYDANTGGSGRGFVGYFQYDNVNVGVQKSFNQNICCSCNVLKLTDENGNPLPSNS